MRRGIAAFALAAALVLAIAPAPAGAADRLTTLDGFDAAGPARFDKVGVVKVGPRRARRVLVLSPGTSAGAGYLLPLAHSLVDRLPGWQVWAVERRENLLEDHRVLDAVRAGDRPVADLFPYYLGWLTGGVAEHFAPPADSVTAPARGWGMRVAVQDLRRVIRAARRGGRRVVLGGHSLGGTITTAYATWDFGGRTGARDLDGLVYIDGGSAPSRLDAGQAEAQLIALQQGSPFNDLVGLGVPWAAGVFGAVGATLARKAPDEPSAFQGWPLAPAALKPPVPVTNEAQFGHAIDTETGPPSLALVQAHLGGLAASGDPRGWDDEGGRASVQRVARAVSGIRGADGFAWYHPRRLSLDAGVVNGGRADPAQRVLGVRATRGRAARLPIYALETSLGRGRVLAAARALAARARVPARRVTLVDRSASDAHCDPIFDDPGRNAFLRTVVPFLKRL
jgi:hypothetical protein